MVKDKSKNNYWNCEKNVFAQIGFGKNSKILFLVYDFMNNKRESDATSKFNK